MLKKIYLLCVRLRPPVFAPPTHNREPYDKPRTEDANRPDMPRARFRWRSVHSSRTDRFRIFPL